MSKEREQTFEERRRLKKAHGELFDAVSSPLFRHDPIELNYESHTDEYDFEAGTVLPRFRSCKTATDVQQVVHEGFVRWFGLDNSGPKEHHSKIGEEIWHLWKKSN